MSTYTFTEEKLKFLKSFLTYDPETGEFRRKDGKNRNRNLKNPAATAKTYKQINVNGVIYYAHILAWWFMTGAAVPDGYEIDHKDRNRRNCRWSNLVLATSSGNKSNVLRCDTPHGVAGVHKRPGCVTWSAEIRVNHISHFLGRFTTWREAVAARLAAEVKYLGRVVSTQANALLEAETS